MPIPLATAAADWSTSVIFPGMILYQLSVLQAFFLCLPDEAEDVELLDLTIGIEAVQRVLFFVVNVEHSGELRQDEQFEFTASQIEQLQGSTGGLGKAKAHDHRAKARRVDVVNA